MSEKHTICNDSENVDEIMEGQNVDNKRVKQGRKLKGLRYQSVPERSFSINFPKGFLTAAFEDDEEGPIEMLNCDMTHVFDVLKVFGMVKTGDEKVIYETPVQK